MINILFLRPRFVFVGMNIFFCNAFMAFFSILGFCMVPGLQMLICLRLRTNYVIRVMRLKLKTREAKRY